MLDFLKKSPRKVELDRNILRKNDISILILDERWNSLFGTTEKTPDILKSEEDVRGLLMEQSRLITESKELAREKKECLERILQLTTEAYENNNENARSDMLKYQKEIEQMNARLAELEKETGAIPDRIRDANLKLLEQTVNIVYFKIRADQLKVAELDKHIEETKEKLREYNDMRDAIALDDTNIYTFFHELLGPEQLEKLDKEYFG